MVAQVATFAAGATRRNDLVKRMRVAYKETTDPFHGIAERYLGSLQTNRGGKTLDEMQQYYRHMSGGQKLRAAVGLMLAPALAAIGILAPFHGHLTTHISTHLAASIGGGLFGLGMAGFGAAQTTRALDSNWLVRTTEQVKGALTTEFREAVAARTPPPPLSGNLLTEVLRPTAHNAVS